MKRTWRLRVASFLQSEQTILALLLMDVIFRVPVFPCPRVKFIGILLLTNTFYNPYIARLLAKQEKCVCFIRGEGI
jgi:hypothetical protein